MIATAMTHEIGDGEYLRALVCRDPGRAPELYIERISLGEESGPIAVVESVAVTTEAVNTIEDLAFVDDFLEFTADAEPPRMAVRVRPEIATQAIRA